MMAAWFPLGAALAALAAAGWAGLLVLLEEAPSTGRLLAEGSPRAASTARASQAGRLSLLLLAGIGASLAIGWWARPVLEGALSAFVALALLYLLGEGLPRSIGMLAPAFADAAAPVGRRTLGVFAPLLAVLRPVERGCELLLPPLAPDSRPLGRGERDLLAGVLSLRDATIADVMTPRLDIIALEAQASWQEVLEVAAQSGHARIPVYEGDLDTISGVLYAKDLTPAVAGVSPEPDQWQQLVRPVQFVPESKTLAAQLHDFQRGPGHLAIVVDEFGGTSGLVTLEDILEEVVGEIRGEYDVDEAPEVEREGDARFWVAGSVSLDTLSDALGTPISDDEVSTVGGLIYSELGRVPRPGEELRIGEFRVVVEQVVRRRVRRVYFERLDGTSVEAAAERSE